MIDISDIQSTIATALEAAFPSQTVITDDGLKHNELEAALRLKGFALVVSPILAATPLNQAAGKAIADTKTAIMVCIAPKRNSEQTTPEVPITAVKTALAAVLAVGPEGDQQKFTMDSEGIQIDTDDPGLWIYALYVAKTAVL